MTPRILTFVSSMRNLPLSHNSIHGIKWDGEMRYLFERGGDTDTNRHINCLKKAQAAREWALSGDFDAMLILDDDMIYPPDTLYRLLAVNSPLAYGLYIWRNEPHYWTACHELHDERIIPYGLIPGDRETAWGNIIETHGVGTGCLLIQRAALEALPFHRRNIHGYDYTLAMDAVERGIVQKMDCGLLCGHIDTENRCVYWPTIEGYRSDPL